MTPTYAPPESGHMLGVSNPNQHRMPRSLSTVERPNPLGSSCKMLIKVHVGFMYFYYNPHETR